MPRRKKPAADPAASTGPRADIATRFQPGNIYRWKPGQSGNPLGTSQAKAEAAEYIEGELRSNLEQIVTALRLHAIKGSPTHMVEVLNRVAGKVVDKIDHTNNGEAFADASPAELRKVAEEILDNLKFSEGRESILQ